jgi:hypothetical protein
VWVGPNGYLEELVVRWEALHARAAIVGVHGAGKSTLLEHFVPCIAEVVFRRDAAGQLVQHAAQRVDKPCRQAVWLQLRKSAPASMVIPWQDLCRGRLLIIDGYEQFVYWRRAALIARTKLRGVKLLLTSHRRTVLPTLCELSVSAATARQIVSQLTLGRGDFQALSDEEMQERLLSHGGNMREVLMSFYDQVEENRVRRNNPSAG